MNSKITVLLCTVRPDNGYIEHPEWRVLDKVAADLAKQTFKDFELIVVDGVPRKECPDEPTSEALPYGAWPVAFELGGYFNTRRVRPRDTLWTRNHKVAICAYRNTGLIHARGELVVNLDDCCELPPIYLEAFWRGWSKHRVCFSALWPERHEESGRVKPLSTLVPVGGRPNCWRPNVYGFGSYPLKTALELNGYDEAYDGGQGLEDADWSLRLYRAGVKMAHIRVPGFSLHSQSAHDPRAIDPEMPLGKCCNPAWWVEQQLRDVQVANVAELWTGANAPFLRKLVGPCELLNKDDTCAYHNGTVPCAYLSRGWPRELSAEAEAFLKEPPVFNLKELRKAAAGD